MRKTTILIAVLAVLIGLTAAVNAGGYSVIYKQSDHHVQYPDTWYTTSYGSFDSAIIGQHFSPAYDGVIKEVSIGGGFEFEAGMTTPASVIFEVWEPLSPGGDPGYPPDGLLARWTIQTSALIDEFDAEGSPLITAVLNPNESLPVSRGHDYLFFAYSDSDSTSPLCWTMDMSNGPGDLWVSLDAGASYLPHRWFGDPRLGNPVSNMEYELRGDAVCEEGVLIDQTVKHVQYNVPGDPWYRYGANDTPVSNIAAVDWSPYCSGLVEEITVGGAALEGFEPASLVFDIWQAESPGGFSPGAAHILLARWIVPWGDLTDDVDADGLPLKIADVSADPFEVAAGGAYLFSAYSSGDETMPLLWTVDMSYGDTFIFWESTDNTTTWSGYNFGDPAVGDPTANFEFALRGKTGTLTTVVTPGFGVWGRYDPANADKPFFNAGWNWWSAPYPPEGDSDPASFDGFSYDILRNRLYRWENRNTELYPDDFTVVEPYRGYIANLVDSIAEVSYEARRPVCPTVEITLVPGWNWIGVPVTISVADVQIRNDQTSEVRTAEEDKALGAGAWLNWNWTFFDSASRTYRLVALSGGSDDTDLRQWFGYRLLVLTLNDGETYTLIVPSQ